MQFTYCNNIKIRYSSGDFNEYKQLVTKMKEVEKTKFVDFKSLLSLLSPNTQNKLKETEKNNPLIFHSKRKLLENDSPSMPSDESSSEEKKRGN